PNTNSPLDQPTNPPNPSHMQKSDQPTGSTMHLETATEADAPALAALYFTCFTNAAHRRVFPPTPEMHAWWTASLRRKIASGRSLPSASSSSSPAPAPASSTPLQGLEQTQPQPPETHTHTQDAKDPTLPPNLSPSDKDLLLRLRAQTTRHREEDMRGVEGGYYYLSILGTNPAYRSQGLGSRLLAWGIERARAEGRQIYLCASREGRPLYVKRGFVRVSEGEVV
ncbi:GNAT family N-acetyltransferase, partial [Aspergillus aculeatinus CBS 121060]